MKIQRDKLLTELRMVQAGLAQKETLEQSTCFVFRKGIVFTYNDEVACRGPCSLVFTGAINARKMTDMLARWPEDVIEFHRVKGRLQFKGKARRGYFRVQDTIILPLRDIEQPKKWFDLPEGFLLALELVRRCACGAEESPHLSCVHFLPNRIEACDGVQAGRVSLKTPYAKSVLIRAEALKYLLPTNMIQTAETKNWVHFRNPDGLIMSCHKCHEDYPSQRLSNFFATKGEKASLPEGLKRLVDRLSVFLDEAGEHKWLEVEIKPKSLQLTGQGAYGSQTERVQIKYRGKPLGFSINPDLMRELANKHDRCEVSERVVCIRKKNFQYLTSVWTPHEQSAKKKKR